jgi:hypothetical protein
MLEHIINTFSLTAHDAAWPTLPVQHHQGPPRGRWLVRPYSRSKYRPHTAQSGSREALRRARQIAKGMLQVSPEAAQKEAQEGRQVKPRRSGGRYASLWDGATTYVTR